jgi:hypothetical protein
MKMILTAVAFAAAAPLFAQTAAHAGDAAHMDCCKDEKGCCEGGDGDCCKEKTASRDRAGAGKAGFHAGHAPQ